ncbi:MAG TPA: hypothetical protein VGM56_21925 [Byssovorax sp.]|jgi:hypothetical protein
MKTIEEVARDLARAHVEEDRETQHVFLSPHDKEVRLVEVTRSLEPSGEVLPFRFAPHGDEVPFPSVIVLLSEDDWRLIEADELHLPTGWERQKLQKLT